MTKIEALAKRQQIRKLINLYLEDLRDPELEPSDKARMRQTIRDLERTESRLGL